MAREEVASAIGALRPEYSQCDPTDVDCSVSRLWAIINRVISRITRFNLEANGGVGHIDGVGNFLGIRDYNELYLDQRDEAGELVISVFTTQGLGLN